MLPGLLLSMTAFAPKPDGPLTRGRLRDEDGIGGCGAGRGGDDEPRGASRSGRRGANRLREVPGGENARDLQQVRSVLWDSPKFLWVSDGRSVWGPDALVERMSQFQRAEVLRVEPDLAKAVPVELSGTTAYLNLPLVLTIGSNAKPDRLRFLVSVLGIETSEGWRMKLCSLPPRSQNR